MITLSFYKNKQEETIAFDAMGHAGFAKAGKPDIFCSAVTGLIATIITSFEDILSLKVQYTLEEGNIACQILNYDSLDDKVKQDTQLLMQVLKTGCEQYIYSYGKAYLKIKEKSVKDREVI